MPNPLHSLVVLLLFAAAGFAQEPPKDLRKQPRPKDGKELLATMAAMTGLEARFEEEKHLTLLAVPLKSSGRLFFLRQGKDGGYLTRVVEAPEPQTVRISPKELRVENRDGIETIDLQRADKVRTFVMALVQVFAGDEASLAKSFTVEFTPDPANEQGWTLSLLPRGKPLDQMLKSLVLVGEGTAVVRIEMHDPNGDRTVTKVTTANPARTFDDAEKKKLFGIDAR